MNKIKTLCKISLVSIALILLLVFTALAATENNTGNATIKDNYVSSTALATTEKSNSFKITETQISTSGSAYNPEIYGNRIVWEDQHSGNYDIYMYDLSTKKQTQITSSPDNQGSPAIYGDKIVWEDDGGQDDDNTNHGIYMYDISTKQKMKISATGSAYHPAIYDNRIVWQYNGNIYMGTVSSAPQPKSPVAAFSAYPTSGNAPLKIQFTDKSANSPTSWKWSFGDKTYSTAKNPVHKYSKAGKYTVSLTVKNAKGSNTKTMNGYIVAKK